MNARLYPTCEEYVLDGVGGAHHDVGFVDGIFRPADRIDRDAENGAHLTGERRAVVAVGAEATDGVDVAQGAHGHQLRAGLPTRTQNADGLRVLAREIFDAEAVRRADADTLQHAVGHDREGLAGLGREQQDEADIAAIRGEGHFHPAEIVALFWPGHDVRVDADRPDAQFRNDGI